MLEEDDEPEDTVPGARTPAPPGTLSPTVPSHPAAEAPSVAMVGRLLERTERLEQDNWWLVRVVGVLAGGALLLTVAVVCAIGGAIAALLATIAGG